MSHAPVVLSVNSRPICIEFSCPVVLLSVVSDERLLQRQNEVFLSTLGFRRTTSRAPIRKLNGQTRNLYADLVCVAFSAQTQPFYHCMLVLSFLFPVCYEKHCFVLLEKAIPAIPIRTLS